MDGDLAVLADERHLALGGAVGTLGDAGVLTDLEVRVSGENLGGHLDISLIQVIDCDSLYIKKHFCQYTLLSSRLF